MSKHSRRAFLKSLAASSAVSLFAHSSALSQSYPQPVRRVPIVRKSAAELNSQEIEWFKRGYELLIKTGVMDDLILAHGDMSQEQHELAPNVTLLTFHLMPYPGGERFLAWHRAFLLEFELALRHAVYEAYGAGPLKQVFVPYWDASHATSLPNWVADFRPTGMYARSVEGLPPGHPGYGKTVYEVEVTRYDTKYIVAPNLPVPSHVNALLNLSDYQSFTRRLEWAPTISRTPTTSELMQLRTLAARVVDPQANYTLLAEFLTQNQLTTDQETRVFQLLARLESALMDANYIPGVSQAAVRDLLTYTMQFYLIGPHTDIHTWVAGHDRLVKGTALYFHETAADPVFWMLHAEVDRIWNTWQTRWTARPNLQGQDALFTPYSKGRTWTLAQLLDYGALPYRYDQLYVA